MTRVKQISILLLRLILASVAMLIAYMLGSMMIGETNLALTPEEEAQAGQALLIVSVSSALVLSFPILRSPWYGLKLMGAVFAVQFGVETFMAQIETLYFNSAVQMETAMLTSIVVAGALRAFIFAPLAVLIFGKLKESSQPEGWTAPALPSAWRSRFAALSVFYAVVYFLFGYFVAWQWEEVRLYYTGSTAIKPVLTHLVDLFFREDPFIILFQLLRGALWTFLAVVIVRMMLAKRWEVSLAVALIFAVLLAFPLAFFPNPYMPAMVARAHFFEITSSMLLFGAVAGWALYTPEGNVG